MIKVTYKTVGEGLKKPEETTVRIYEGKWFVSYNIPNKAEQTVKKMKEDGRKRVLYSRGCLIQLFTGLSEEEILEIAKKDIENGLYVAEEKTKKKMEVIDLVIEKK
jgi:hypothetical protein